MNRNNRHLALVMLLGFGSGLLSNSAVAQLIPDNSLGTESSIVTPQDVRDLIEGGAIRGNNLFHSFSEFNVNNSQAVYFLNPTGIENILTRVTGNNVSNILGTLGVEGTANLFLLNPNGILFGENAQLDLNGSFFVSTGESLVFENGFAFSAENPTSPPLLTINVPLGVQYGSNGLGNINNAGALTVQSGQSLVFNGNEIHNTGVLTALEGQVELLGNEVILGDGTGIEADLIRIQAQNNITIADQSNDQLRLAGNGGLVEMLADTNGDGVGNVVMEDTTSDTIKTNGQNIAISGANLILGNIDTSQFAVSGGDILATVNVDASGAIPEVGTSGVALFTFTVSELAEPISNLDVIFSAAHTWDSDLEVFLTSPAGTSFLLFSGVGGSGENFQDTLLDDGAETNISSGNAPFNGTFQPMGEGGLAIFDGENPTGVWQLEVIDLFEGDSGQLYSAGETAPWGEAVGTQLIFRTPSTVESGASGSIILNATSGSVSTGNVNSSSIFDASGFISINANNGGIQAGDLNSSNSLENGGDVNLVANENIITQTINTSSQTAKGGNISLLANQSVNVINSSIYTTTQGNSRAGNLTIQAGGTNPNFPAIQLVNTTIDVASFGSNGRTGDIILEATNGGAIALLGENSSATIFADTFADDPQVINQRTGGNIQLFGGDITIDGYTLVANVNIRALGNGGNVLIHGDSVFITNDAEISTTTLGSGKGGNIDIHSDNLFLDASVIDAETRGTGQGGKISIISNLLNLNNRAVVSTATLGSGDGGNINIESSDVFIDRESEVRSLVFDSGNGGDINVQSQQLTISDNSALIGDVAANWWASGTGGDINLNVSGTLLLVGGSPAPTGESTRITAGVQPNATGLSGDININAGSFLLQDGAILKASTASSGNAGNILIRANNVDISGSVPSSGLPSGLLASSTSTGQAGNITVESDIFHIAEGAVLNTRSQGEGNGGNIFVNTRTFEAVDGGQLVTTAFAQGEAGNILVNATEKAMISGSDLNYEERLAKFPPFDPLVANRITETGAGSGLYGNTQANSTGNGGNLRIEAGQLILENGALISASTQGEGNGGDISLNITESISLTNSSVSAAVEVSSFGKGGNITLSAPNILLRDRALLSATTQGQGNAGTVFLSADHFQGIQGAQIRTTTASDFNAGNITLKVTDSISLSGEATGLFANTETDSKGNSGNISLNSSSIAVQNQASIAVNSQGSGEGGRIELQGESLTLNNQAFLTAATASNQGGDISVQLNDLLLMRNNSQITATAGTAEAGGDGGNIDIKAKFIVAFPNENSDITANAFEGKGGNISLTAESIFGLQFRESQTPLSDITASSEFGLAGTVEITTPDVNPSEGLVELPEDVIDTTTLVAQSCAASQGKIASQRSEFIITGRGGLPANPNESLTHEAILADWVTMKDAPISGTFESMETVSSLSQSQNQVLEAQGWIVSSNGTLILTATPSTPQPQSSGQPSVSCQT